MVEAEVPAIKAGASRERLEQLDALADELDLLRVVELQAKGTGRDRRRHGRQRGATLEHDHAQPGASGEERGRAADDPATDDRDVCGGGRGIGETDGRCGAHRTSLGR